MPHCLIDIAKLRAWNNTIKTESSIRKCITQPEENSATQIHLELNTIIKELFIYNDVVRYSGTAIALLSTPANKMLPTC
jgi:hypothetical protein